MRYLQSVILLAFVSSTNAFAGPVQSPSGPLFGSPKKRESRPTRQTPSTPSYSDSYLSPPKSRESREATSSSDDSSSSESKKKSKFIFSALYSSANEASYKGSGTFTPSVTIPVTASGSYSATESTGGVFGLSGAYQFNLSESFGLVGGVAYEFPRKSSGIQGTANTNVGNYRVIGTYSGDVSTSLLSGAVNLSYAPISWISVYAGGNFPIIFTSASLKLSGLPGYQAGVGAKFGDHFGVRLEYRVLRMKGDIDIPNFKLSIDEARLPGMMLFFDYSL